MGVKRCHICATDPEVRRLHGRPGLADGSECPICYRPTCQYHLSIVRWKWRQDNRVDSVRICRYCKSSYAHRNWDVINRDWIT